jgi:hypothetical protein
MSTDLNPVETNVRATYGIAVDQIYQDNDKRESRRVRVLSVQSRPGKAACASCDPQGGHLGRTVWISFVRLSNKRFFTLQPDFMNDQTSTQEQLYRTADLADKNGMYDAADWIRNSLRSRPLRFYKTSEFGVVGATVDHQDGEYTMLRGHTRKLSWIQTSDLHETREGAEAAPIAVFAEQTP